MAIYKAAIAVPFLVASVSAWGNSVIKNSCGSPVYYWEDQGVAYPPMETIQPGASFTKQLYQTKKDNGAGPSIKIAAARADGSMPEETDALTQFEYTVDAPNFRGRTSCDISNVDGKGDPPFVAGGVSVSSPQDPSLSRTCPAGQNPCKQGYTQFNDDWATVVTDMGNDIVMELCGPSPGTKIPGGGNGGDKNNKGDKGGNNKGGDKGGNNSPSPIPSPSSSDSAPPPPTSTSAAVAASSSAAPAPSQPPVPVVKEKLANAPSPPQQDGSTQVVWVTEYAPAETVIVHVNGKREEAPEKRQEHIHNHAHAHNKINKRRHGA